MTEYLDPLRKLHTVLIDSRKGYEEALTDADGNDIAPLFREMINLRDEHHAEIDAHVREAGETPDESGSFLSVVHRTIFKIRALVNANDNTVIPGMIDGEERIVTFYDDVLRSAPPPAVASTLNGQVMRVREQIAKMQAMDASTHI
ncbi:MAG: PA2169 family four-helix-bundle protein [Beijerinckiaceae bacterium]|nr:PA2169 family four-helix-bundle protein [Beijerinckiaceae bacterium]